ncbi:MAG: ATP-dependent metallopeptidase FtsH/Yme1/Tma family protein [Proteobacteria bacterium]|nr:ATP-dependent metallopeptidase FtsH/Yme1/Tma family protein [Pseudomonadota bacterium]
MGKSKPRSPLPYLVGFFLILLALNFWVVRENTELLSYSDFLARVERGEVKDVRISKEAVSGVLKTAGPTGKKGFSAIRIEDPQLISLLQKQQVTFTAEPEMPFWFKAMLWAIPLLLLFRFWSFSMKRGFGEGRGGLLGLTRSKAKLFIEKDITTTFDDVAGVDEAKEELSEVVQFLENPERFSRLGGRIPKGVLLVGPPGTGKTLMARAIAGEAKVPFLSINGSEFIEMFVGLGAARVRDLFQQARDLAPCILFIDEIDAVGKLRAAAVISGGNEEKEQTLGQLLAEMDGFDSSKGVIILAATNRPEILDPALLRAGRFDRQVLIDNPDQRGRAQILKVHIKKIKLDPKVSLENIASLTPGFSGADLANLVNEAALFATRRNGDSVSDADFDKAIERIVAGLEKHSRIMHPDEKRRIAYHEMGHATASLVLGPSEKVHKISIVPRGLGSLGYTIRRPTEDRYLLDEDQMIRKIAVLLGGRAAETLFLNSPSTGAADDLVKATDLARSMVTRFGMSDPIGLAALEDRELAFITPEMVSQTRIPISEETAKNIDHEVKNILEKALRLAVKELSANRTFIEKGAQKLMEQETLDEKDILELWEKCTTKKLTSIKTTSQSEKVTAYR